jgi:hypothetical protein
VLSVSWGTTAYEARKEGNARVADYIDRYGWFVDQLIDRMRHSPASRVSTIT